MSTALDKIIEYKRDEVAALKRARSTSDLLAAAHAQDVPRGFAAALSHVVETGENALICEMKRKSPSAGEILPGADPSEIAVQYETGGAACLSVLTDGPSFGGSPADFATIRNAVSIPMLRKDFMIDTAQVVEARAMGADAVLVILSCADDALALDLIQTAIDLGMDSLIETHDEVEVERALALPSSLIGVNNRDLKIMKTDLATSERLAPMIPAGRDFISESGISDPEDIVRLRECGARRFLIGESLMKRTDRQAHVARLRSAE
ncbi:indole-3-glycerol phosphate synthase TrpC [Hyphomonas sp. FCG-A18]|uniref:indole-3-glycerol phosphate synthase TrpC n=1 Tax=Hyphomonas sp. FCG-A18 TaxID=3080019 RepID=UPI002B306512|nr:indole-3-glycerol phosphate synthase TrpC [Hyphomonas sp. FCG-A18]